ncbi:hypothetical protein CCY99_09050 [Helicobacter sp. 16-1353]|uniref:SPASM domain-containing protein n=1 Tax=Helicobacter sp. 16-1353 TaxID=2004996 RepID=UPI000DCEC5E7|nr:SPASM domain-containing protein [Helicobacter sp. 16-1353]RAX51418.1 hypothetical protein CCY99_09050 [Helicobacter sp. 16-1353]
MAMIGGGVIHNLSINQRQTPCIKIFREFTIDYQGRVFPCCNLFPDDINNAKYIFGNLKNESIFDIFSSKIWAKWRENLFIDSPKSTPCKTCNDGYFGNHNQKAHLRLLENLT